MVGVHNGIIENFAELKAKLLRHGYTFYSETDTEVLIKLVDYYYKKYKIGPIDALTRTMVRVRGSYAVALMFRDFPGEIFAARKDSPMIIGLTENEGYLASDVTAMLKYTRTVYYIGNAQAARLAGMNPKRIVTTSFVTMGLLCAIGGIVYVARMQSGQPAANVNLEFDAITAVILGGVSFSGGVGSMPGTVIGVLLIQSFNTGLNMAGIANANFWQYVGKGALLLIALTADYIRKVNNDKRLLAESKKNR